MFDLISEIQCVILGCYSITGWADFRTRRVNAWYFVVAYLLIALISGDYIRSLIPAVLTLFFTRDNKYCGGADLDAWLLLSLERDIFIIIETILFSGMIAIGYRVLSKKEGIPYVACIGVGYLLDLIVVYWVG